MLVVCSFAILIVRLKTLGRDIIRNNKCTFQPYSIPDCPVCKGKSSLSVALAASSANYSSNQAYTTHSRALAGAIFHSCSTTSGTTLIPVLNFSGSTVPLGNASST